MSTCKFYTSRHVIFDKTIFPFSTTSSTSFVSPPLSIPSDSSLPFLLSAFSSPSNSSGPSNIHSSPPASSIPHPLPTSPIINSSSSPSNLSSFPISTNLVPSSDTPLSTAIVTVPAPTTSLTNNDAPSVPLVCNSHSMQTRVKSGITKRKIFLTNVVSSSDMEPSLFTIAFKSPIWRQAMSDEFDALLRQDTWELTPLPLSKSAIGCKWVYRVKRNPDGSIARHKARLVAKGYHQQEGIDFKETFSPVVKKPTVRIIFSLAAQFGWSLRQLDVKNAFLHGELSEEVYMQQPQGFIDPSRPHHVCKLLKSLYGLKQAPRAWFECFTSHLLTLGFIASKVDSSLFVFRTATEVLYLLLYVDDIIITGPNTSLITQLVSQLQTRFDMTDLGDLTYFLGLEIKKSVAGLHVSQTKYARDVLTRFGMASAKLCTTLIALKPSSDVGARYSEVDSSCFRALVGALHYLTFSRPDIAYSVSKLSQFMHTPHMSHLTAAKRVLRYISGTLTSGLLFRRGSSDSLSLTAYSDSDWAGDLLDRRSTTGYVIFLGPNPVSWGAKKQSIVSRSSTEAEYRALASTSAELFWIRQILCDLGVFISTPHVLLCDNQSAIQLARNPVFHGRTKHIEIDFHFVRERVIRKDIDLRFVSTSLQLADMFTKSLTSDRLCFL